MIFLAEIILKKTRYMGDTTEHTVMRLVLADDENAAVEKVIETFDSGGHGDDSVSVLNVNVSEMIQ